VLHDDFFGPRTRSRASNHRVLFEGRIVHGTLKEPLRPVRRTPTSSHDEERRRLEGTIHLPVRKPLLYSLSYEVG
jgi:hypothetical protein